jgi:hypothetical protein
MTQHNSAQNKPSIAIDQAKGNIADQMKQQMPNADFRCIQNFRSDPVYFDPIASAAEAGEAIMLHVLGKPGVGRKTAVHQSAQMRAMMQRKDTGPDTTGA